MADELKRHEEKPIAPGSEDNEPPLLTKEEAIVDVKRLVERCKIDPNQIFARTGLVVIRYGDLISHLKQETDEGRLLLRAISWGRVIRGQRGLLGGVDSDRK